LTFGLEHFVVYGLSRDQIMYKILAKSNNSRPSQNNSKIVNLEPPFLGIL